MKKKQIILASKSKRRQELLDLIDIKYTTHKSNFNEEQIKYTGNIFNYVIDIAKGKTEKIKKIYPDEIILGADTIVYINDKILGKPKTKKEAFDYLKLLSGKTHKVITGICIYNGITKEIITDYSVTEVTVQEMEDEEILWYIDKDNVLDAAGAYRIQNEFSRFILSINGNYHNIVGLPINKIYNYLKVMLSLV